MKLVKQTRLEFREGSSDKVYEVDLCELSPGSFTVNFRYGRRGSTLKEGSKSARPVSRAEAETAFDELVVSKTKKGYRLSGAPVSERTEPSVVPSTDGHARARAVLKRLGTSSASEAKRWPIERAIWRAGELRLREAVPLIQKHVNAKNPMRTYCVAWALGLCGDASAIPTLVEFFKSPVSPDHVRRIAREALLRLADEPTREEFRVDTTSGLPEPLRSAALGGNPEKFDAAFAEYAAADANAAALLLETLYLIDTPTVRPSALTTLRTAPFAPPWFRSLRHIFKAAEYRRDAEVFGILAYRMEKERARFRRVWWDERRISIHGDHFISNQLRKDALLGPNPKTAFGAETRNYFRTRVARVLKRLGEIGDPDYVRMAVGVLLPFTDSDGGVAMRSVHSRWVARRLVNTESNWDTFAQYLAFNAILRGGSARYELAPSGRAWRCKPSYRPGGAEPPDREEAFAHLWDAMPAGLLHLLSESECRPIHQFAVKALRSAHAFVKQLDTDVIVMLLGRPYEETSRFGLELAVARFDPNAPDFELVLALATCPLPEAREQARAWIDAARRTFSANLEFVTCLATCEFDDVRTHARLLLLSTPYAPSEAKELTRRLIARLIALEPLHRAVAADLASMIAGAFGQQLRTIELSIVLDLLDHPVHEVQEFGGRILLDHEIPAFDLPAEVFGRLVGSTSEAVRGLGLRLFGQLPHERLFEDEPLVGALVASPFADVRAAARQLVRVISPADGGLEVARRSFVTRLGARIVELFDGLEPSDGVFDDLAHLLVDDLDEWLLRATIDMARRLVRGSSAAAQYVGGSVFLAHREWATEVQTDELVALGRHDIKSVRDAARTLFEAATDRFAHTSPDGQEQLLLLSRVLDNRWDDARGYWFGVFRSTFNADHLTPSVLVSICDSPREDVRALGRELITTHFRDDGGLEYLTRLSEHPSGDMRLFVTNFLERFAAGEPSRIADLRLYFVTVLSSVNTSRIGKDRVLDFLRVEAEKNEESARVVAGILERLSATAAIGDRATAIEAMVGLRRTWPDVPLPIEIRPVAVRAGAPN
jgi:predicted DNA-binding WGR domain protein